MTDKEAKIKKIKKGLKIALLGTLMAVTISTSAGCRDVKFDDYATTSQIETVAEYFDCDTSYLTKFGSRFVQMEHNGDEPIYVCFDDSLTQEEIESAKKSLDEIFGVVGKINKSYRYEIVDKGTYNSKLNRTKIYYDLGSHNITKNDSADAFILRMPSLISFLTNKRTYNDFRIYYDREQYKDDETRDYVLKHELFHAFGIEDVYEIKDGHTQDAKLNKSLINRLYGAEVQMLTPNDVKCLISLYQEKQETPEKQEEYLEEMKEFFENYEKEFYFNFAQKCKDKTNLDYNFDERCVKSTSPIIATIEDGRQFYYTYNVDIQGDEYKFSITNEKGKVLDSCVGEVVWTNDVAVLKDVNLKGGLMPGFDHYSYVQLKEYVQDLAVLKSTDSTVVLYDYLTNNNIYTETLQLGENVEFEL